MWNATFRTKRRSGKARRRWWDKDSHLSERKSSKRCRPVGGDGPDVGWVSTNAPSFLFSLSQLQVFISSSSSSPPRISDKDIPIALSVYIPSLPITKTRDYKKDGELVMRGGDDKAARSRWTRQIGMRGAPPKQFRLKEKKTTKWLFDKEPIVMATAQ